LTGQRVEHLDERFKSAVVFDERGLQPLCQLVGKERRIGILLIHRGFQASDCSAKPRVSYTLYAGPEVINHRRHERKPDPITICVDDLDQTTEMVSVVVCTYD
jgi:hypothetical protein